MKKLLSVILLMTLSLGMFSQNDVEVYMQNSDDSRYVTIKQNGFYRYVLVPGQGDDLKGLNQYGKIITYADKSYESGIELSDKTKIALQGENASEVMKFIENGGMRRNWKNDEERKKDLEVRQKELEVTRKALQAKIDSIELEDSEVLVMRLTELSTKILKTGEKGMFFSVVAAKDKKLVGWPVFCEVVEARKSNIVGSEGRMIIRPKHILVNNSEKVKLMPTDIYKRGLNRTNITFWLSPLIAPIFIPGTGAKIEENEIFKLELR